MPIANSPASALVIGSGIVGLSSAIALQRRGIATTLVAPDAMHGTASWGNAGHVAVEQVEPLASFATVRGLPHRLFARGGALSLEPRHLPTWLPFSLRLLWAARPRQFERGRAALTGLLAAAMPAWRRLADAVGRPDLLVEHGHYVVWESAASAAAGRARWMAAPKGTTQCFDLPAATLARIQSLVRVPLAGGIGFGGSGQIADLDALGDALDAAFRALGGVRHAGTVTAIDPRPLAVRLADGDVLGADIVLVAAGARSAPLLTPLGLRVPLVGERGYHLQAPAPAWPLDLAPVVFEDRSMIATRFRTGLRAASFVEFGPPDAAPDPRKWERLRAHADALGLPMEGAQPWMGARPTLPDYLPAIGAAARHPGLFYAFGHQHLGLTLGPLTGEIVAAAVTGGGVPGVDLAPFDLARFG